MDFPCSTKLKTKTNNEPKLRPLATHNTLFPCKHLTVSTNVNQTQTTQMLQKLCLNVASPQQSTKNRTNHGANAPNRKHKKRRSKNWIPSVHKFNSGSSSDPQTAIKLQDKAQHNHCFHKVINTCCSQYKTVLCISLNLLSKSFNTGGATGFNIRPAPVHFVYEWIRSLVSDANVHFLCWWQLIVVFD